MDETSVRDIVTCLIARLSYENNQGSGEVDLLLRSLYNSLRFAAKIRRVWKNA